MESLLPYYERELVYLRRLSQDFAGRYPKVASRLLLSGETCEDPHVERLIESFAFLTSRIHKKLDDDFPEITDSLLSVVYPQYLKPFPSVSIAHFDVGSAASQLTKAVRIPRGTMVNTGAVRGVACRFRTAYDVDLSPLQIVSASHETRLDSASIPREFARTTASVICLKIAAVSESGFSFEGALHKLRLFLNGDASLVSRIREAMLSNVSGIWVTASGVNEKISLPTAAIQPVGFAADESLLEYDARSHHAYMLLLEYLVYPEKFNFIDIDLAAVQYRLPPHVREITLRIGLKSALTKHAVMDDVLERIGKENFVLGCSPVVNLFPQKSEPIRITNTVSSYPIIVDNNRNKAFDIYSIDRVFKVQKSPSGERIDEFQPFYSIRHGHGDVTQARYWHISQGREMAGSESAMQISLIDSSLPSHRHEAGVLSMTLTCTNGDLPSQLPFGLPEGDLHMEGGSIAKSIRFLRKPTRSCRFPRGQGAQWRLISHLSLNSLSLNEGGADMLKEILTLYNITGSISNNKLIGGIVSVETASATARMAGNPFPTFVRGTEVRVKVDESHFVGTGLATFAQILDRFFGLYVQTNSFTRLVFVSSQSGSELIRCQPRSGESILI